MSVSREKLRVAVELGELAVTLVSSTGPSSGTLFVCLPGMTYRGSYFDARFDGHDGYSFAGAMVAHGHAVAVIDHLGTGESSRPDPSHEIDLAKLGAAAAEATEELRVRTGAERVVGIGHSMGGGVLVAQQAAHASFQAIAPLGFTTQTLAGIYEPHEREDELTFEERRDWARQHIPPKLWGASWDRLDPYFALDRSGFAELFYAADVPAAIVEADTALATVAPRQAALDIITPHLGARLAARVEVPVLLAYGDTDLSPDPRVEPAAYAASRDITLVLLEGSAHCHNLATQRHALWDRIVSWAAGLR